MKKTTAKKPARKPSRKPKPQKTIEVAEHAGVMTVAHPEHETALVYPANEADTDVPSSVLIVKPHPNLWARLLEWFDH